MKRRIIAAVIFMSGGALSVYGQGIYSVDIFKNDVFTQTSGVAPTAPSGYFANVELNSVNNNDFDTVSATFPGAMSPTSLTEVDPDFFGWGEGFGSASDMNAAVPVGDYDYMASNTSVSGNNETVTLNYTGDAFASAIPALSAATFNALMGLDPADALVIDFDSFTPNAAATLGNTYFTISDSSGTVFTSGALDPSTTSIELPANTLMANTKYNFELDFSDRQNGTTSPTGGDLVGTAPDTIFTTIGSDLRDDGSFTTGAIVVTPEPGTIFLLFTGLGGLMLMRRATRRTRSLQNQRRC